MHELDRADVEPARRLRRDQHARLARELARDHDFCWLPPESAPAGVSGAAADVEFARGAARAQLERAAPEQPAARRLAAAPVLVEREVLGERERRARARGDGGPPGCARARRRALARALTRVTSRRRPRASPPLDGAGRRSRRSARVWPLPSTPAMPTISPARTSKRDVAHARRGRGRRSTCRSSTSSSGSPGRAGVFSTRSRTSRPTIIRARLSSVAPAASTVSTARRGAAP